MNMIEIDNDDDNQCEDINKQKAKGGGPGGRKEIM